MKARWLLMVCIICAWPLSKSFGQIDSSKFFENDSVVECTLRMDFGKLLRTKLKPQYLPATFNCKIEDSTISEQIQIMIRGHMRREICNIPPIKMNFHNNTSPKLYPLNTIKLVSACYPTDKYDQFLLKEYLAYKIYNLITEKSFRVRLLHLNYVDESGRRKTISEHAFMLENEKALAKRNDCKELKDIKVQTENTDRNQMTLVAIFEYMIGNTDWGVSGNHNTTLIQSKGDPSSRPFVIPYDFDYSGLVNADYAVPNEDLDIPTVRQRLYRGFKRTMDELNDAIAIFNAQKNNIYSLVNNFNLLTDKNKKDVIDYLDDFYKTINDSRQVKNIFINDARQ